jgi:MYXO-CTERM domain-containing protein
MNKTPLRHFLATALFTAACQSAEINQTQEQILGGDVAGVGDFPTVVAILNAGLCTGTLIAPRVVLTAAHCIDPALLGFGSEAQVAANTFIIFDSNNINSNQGFFVGATKTVKNAAFDEQFLGDDDIGLIFLDEEIDDREPSQINLIPKDFIGDRVTQVGFGVSDQNANGGTEVVLENKLVSSCGDANIDELLICYDQTDGTGKCNGDSGGPSFDSAGVVIGVTSFGDTDCVQFGADTNVAGESDFLLDTVANNENLACGADGFDFILCENDPDRGNDGGKDRFRPGGPCSVSAASSGGASELFPALGSFLLGLFVLRRRRSSK